MNVEIAKSVTDVFLPQESSVDIPRQGGKPLRIPIRALSFRKTREIMRKNAPPAPPMQPKRDGSGKVIGLEPNPNDPVYLSQVSEMDDNRTRDMALASITLEGLDESTWDAFSDALTVGDIDMILDAVSELSNVNVQEKAEELKNSSSPE